MKKWIALLMLSLVGWFGCSNDAGRAPDSWSGVCIDQDGDGFGFSCKSGADCDDHDPAIHDGCLACRQPSEGCECEPGAAPVDCSLPRELTETGGLLCKVGTRFCRDGTWSACEGIRSFEAPRPSDFLSRAVVDQDAGPTICDPCNPDCYRVDDPLEQVNDGGLVGDNTVSSGPGGGITLSSSTVDGGTEEDAGLLDDTECTPGVAPDIDCDGVPDEYDPYPYDPPFATDHNTIFMDLPPGASGEQAFEIQFFLNTADVYFYLDMSASMEGERDNLIASLTTGNYLAGGGTDIECADRDFDGTPDEHLKNEGIAGNIACLIRDSRLGAGWFRDIPFQGPYASGIYVAPYDFEMFEHRQDITNDVSAVLSALSGFQTRGNYNAPEGSMQGLYALATGSEVYAGWDRPGIPRRTGCPGGTWGYPCFREDAVPIVIHVTDAALQNGPPTTSGYLESNHPVNYDTAVRDDMTAGTEGTYRQLDVTAESFESAQDVGVIDDVLVTYTGNTEAMNADVTFEEVGACPLGQSAWNPDDQTAADVAFRFQVDTQKELTVSSRGTRFDPALMLLRTDVDIVGQSHSPTGNDRTSSVYDLGTLPVGVHAAVDGNIYSHSHIFAREALGCLTGTGADDLERGAVFKFQLAEDMPLRISTRGSSYLATSLMTGAALEQTDTNMNTISCSTAPGVEDDDCNDNFGHFNIGDVTGKFMRFVHGDTRDGSVNPDFPADGFVAAGCSGVSGMSDDVVFDFSVSSPTRVRVETSGDNSDLQAGFDHALALIERPATIQPILHTPSGNDTQETADAAHDAEVFESEVLPLPSGGWVQYAGNSYSDTADYAQAEVGGSSSGACNNGNSGGSSSARDVVFKFVVTETQTYDFDTFPTNPEFGYKTWLSLHKDRIDTQITKDIVNIASLDDHDFSDGTGGLAVLSSSEGSADARQIVLQYGQMDQRDRSVDPATMGCGSTGNGSPMGGRDALFRFRLDTDASVTLKTMSRNGTPSNTGSPGFDSYMAVFRDSVSAANRVTGSCGNQGGNGYTISNLALTGGHDYYVVVKQWQWTSSLNSSGGRFGLLIEDSRHSSAFLECDAGSHPDSSTYSKITRTLTPGTYYLVIKGPVSGSYYNYQLNVRKTPPTPPIIECANDVSRRAVIERELAPGNYSVVLRGRSAWDSGTYHLSIRDLAAAPVPTACHNTRAGMSNFTQSLSALDGDGQPIDYYLVTRANTWNSWYDLRIDDVRSGTIACADDNTNAIGYNGQSLRQAELTQVLDPGEYVAILKGYNANDSGMFQVTLGDKSKQQSGLFDAKSWLGPSGDGAGGILEALKARGVRVITVRSSSNGALKEQADKLANATGATGSSGQPLTFAISSDGTGMGSAVIDAVNLLSGNLSMDVGVILVEQPDDPSPNFGFKVEALDVPGDSCDPPIDTDGDPEALPDTHVNCRPGATPRFNVTFQNPTPPNNVPSNPNDPNGGWNMKLQLIGDDTYVVDQIPVYIIPEDVVPDPPEVLYEQTGSYEQVISAIGCFGNEAPLWRSLYWDATIPSGTSIRWQMCAADTDEELLSCTFKEAGMVQSGGSCTVPEDCENGYCDGSGVCHYVTGPSCTAAIDCGTGGVCVSNVCLWTQNPIDLKPTVAGGMQGRAKMRVRAVLQSNASRTQAPTIHNWRLDYLCTAQE